MKKLYTLFFVLIITVSISAQAPQKMSYQAVIRDKDNALVIKQVVGMQISILQGSVVGLEVYTETQTPSTNANGLVSIEIGGREGFDAIDWSAGPYFLKTETDPTGGTNYKAIVGTSELLSVPYALHANTVTNYTETDPTVKAINGIVRSNGTTISAAVAGDFPILNQNTMGTAATVTTAAQPAITSVGTLTGLVVSGTTTVATPVNATDATNKAYVDVLKSQIEELQIATGTYKLFDIEGNQYKVVKIGTQVWMAENLKTTIYNDGTAIPNITDNIAWEALTSGAYSDYDNTPANSTTYGRLYNWYAVDNNNSVETKGASNGGKNVCPTGWHVPADLEWRALITYLGGDAVAGDKLKETGTTHWTTPNTGATNETGFTALPGGARTYTGAFDFIAEQGFWRSTTEYDATTAWRLSIFNNRSEVLRYNSNKKTGFSVRCLRD